MTKPAKSLEDAIVAALADGLTPAMRKALLWLPADGSWREEDASVSRSIYHVSTRIVCPGVKAPLAASSIPELVNGRWAKTRWKATPLGLKVRAVGQEKG